MVATYETYDSGVVLNVPADATAAEIQALEQRLQRGWAIIEERARDGQSVERLEDHWLTLLAEYETAYDSAR